MYKNGQNYVGNFVNGKKHGEGIYDYGKGIKYRGLWKNDVWDGKGTFG